MKRISIPLAAAAFSTSAIAVDLPVVGDVNLPVVGTLPGVPALPSLDSIPGLDTLPLAGSLNSQLPGVDLVSEVLGASSPALAPLMAPVLDASIPVLPATHPIISTVTGTVNVLP